MRRALLVALAVAVPTLAGFECTITSDVGWDPGDYCNYDFDFDESECLDSATLMVCDITDTVVGIDCNAQCGSLSGAVCTLNAGWGQDYCDCGVPWEPGYYCNYAWEANASICDTSDYIWYCGTDNVIYERSCGDYCVNDLGADAGSCGMDAAIGGNACVCTYTTCDFASYCDGANWLRWCDYESTGQAQLTDCDSYCVNDMGAVKGSCGYEGGEYVCVCAY